MAICWPSPLAAVQHDPPASKPATNAPLPKPAASTLQLDFAQGPCPNRAQGLAVFTSLVPGVVLHGSGHYVHGCRRTGERLLWVSLAGLGLIAIASAPALLYGAHPYLVPFEAVLGMSGLVLFGGSWLFDVYGSAVERAARGRAQPPALLETLLGYGYVYDPIFSYRHFLLQGFELWQHRLHLMPRADFSLGTHNARYRLPLGYRVWGATPSQPQPDGSFLDAQSAFTHHEFGGDGFDVDTLEASVSSRLDLNHYDPELSGLFLELGAGVGVNRYDYQAPGVGDDVNTLLLMNFAFGTYFEASGARGSAKLYYDHRHDDFAAGLKLPAMGSGVMGHFGVQTKMYLDQAWGLLLDAQVGSAYIANVALLYRQGVPNAW